MYTVVGLCLLIALYQGTPYVSRRPVRGLTSSYTMASGKSLKIGVATPFCR